MSFKGNTFDSPKFRHLIPNLHVGNDGWITSNNSVFAAQVVRCVYPVSEQYCKFPRYLYYCLVISAVLLRKNAWIAATVMGSVMAYSGVAAVHAVLMASSDPSFPAVTGDDARLYDASNWITVDSELRLPVFPQAWDDDGDALLAVVGVAYLMLALMQTYSSTFRGAEAKTVLFLWSLLLLVGMISAFVHWDHVDASAFPQFRFCSSTFNDTLPIANSRFDIVSNGPWNEIIWNAFLSNSSSQGGSGSCIYPCFSSSLAFRYESEINVLPISIIGRIGYPKFSTILNLVYTLVALSGLCSLTIFLIKIAYWNGHHEVRKKFRDFVHSRPFFALSTIVKFGKLLWTIYILGNDLYARFGSIVALLSFVAWAEWLMWYDPQTSEAQNVGQWGTLVGAGLVMLAAVVAEYSPKVDSAFRARIADHDKSDKIFGFNDCIRLFHHSKIHRNNSRSGSQFLPALQPQQEALKDAQGGSDPPEEGQISQADDLGRRQFFFPVRHASRQSFKGVHDGGSDYPVQPGRNLQAHQADAAVCPAPLVADSSCS